MEGDLETLDASDAKTLLDKLREALIAAEKALKQADADVVSARTAVA